MKKFVRNSRDGLRILLRVSLLALVIDANLCEGTTITPASITSNTGGPTGSSSSTYEEGSTVMPPTTPSSQSSGLSTRDETSSQPSQTDEVMSNATSSAESHTIQEFVTEITSNTTSAGGSVSLDTTVWKWRFSWNWVIILQLIISLIGILGNLLVVVVMAVRKSAANSTDIFILALAVFDMLTSFFNIPIPRAFQVPDSTLGLAYCSLITTSCLSWICVISSSYVLVGASFERLAAVIYPLRIKEIFSSRRVYIYIVVTWLFSILSCFYYFVSPVTSSKNPLLARIHCAPGKADTSRLKFINSFNFVIRLVIPCALMMISQIAMAISLHLQSRQLKGAMSRSSKQSYHILARDRIIKTLLVVIIFFILCWAPSQIAFIVVSFEGLANLTAYIRSTVRQSLNLITFINSSVNPFIYAANYPKFRSAIKEVFGGNMQNNKPLFGVDYTQTSKSDSQNIQA